MSKVYLIAARANEPGPVIESKLGQLWSAANLGENFARGDLAALKMHVGEPGTKTFIPPKVVRPLVDLISASGAKPFLTDTAVLYRSPRDNAVEHARVAEEHGFGLSSMGAPFIAADGLDGSDEVEIAVDDGKHFDRVSIATGVMHARSMLVLSHATGHLAIGYGGALKNLGMGCCSRKAKLRQHHGQQPRIREDRCTACGTCQQWCPSDAIAIDEVAAIDTDRCIGCGECLAVCRDDAVAFDWRIMGTELSERIVDHAAAVVRAKRGHLAFITSVQQVTKDCDCLGVSQPGLFEDIGFVAGVDPVALDQAVLDLIRERAGRQLEAMSYPKTDGAVQVQRAEEMGLGSTSYELVHIPAT